MARRHRTVTFSLFALIGALVLGLISAGSVAAAPVLEVTTPLALPHWKLAQPYAGVGPAGLYPATICAAYGLPCTGGAGKTIALVDAYDAPTITADLATFKEQFDITGCNLTVVNERGGAHLPKADASWALEISLDAEWACAVAPSANLLLVEAHTSSLKDLLTAEDYAASHAQYVSNSWGTTEFVRETQDDRHFRHTGVSFFASAGDNGLGPQYPSVSPDVTSVGGTTLSFASDGSVSEVGWNQSGGGCSMYEIPNVGQVGHTDDVTCLGMRATPDVAFDADPRSAVAVYDSTPYDGQSGWFQVGGTSVGSTAWAAISADTGGVVDAALIYGLDVSQFRGSCPLSVNHIEHPGDRTRTARAHIATDGAHAPAGGLSWAHWASLAS